jgi:putative transposase
MVYNLTLLEMKKFPKKSVVDVRKSFIGKSGRLDRISYIKEVPFDVKHEAIKDAFKAKSNAVLKWKKGKKANLKKRRKKDKSESIVICKKHIKKDTFYVRSLGKLGNTNLLSEGDTRLVKTNSGFYFHILVKVENQDFNQKYDVIALDPGVRTFMAGYSPDLCVDIGSKNVGRFYKLKLIQDKLRSKMKKVNSRKRQKLKKAYQRISNKIKHIRDEVHWKTINFLTDNFKNILIPEFNVSNIIRKERRKLNKKTVRQLLAWGHYQFRQRLIQKSYLKKS